MSLADTSLGYWQTLSATAQPAYAVPGWLVYAFPPLRNPTIQGAAYAILVMARTPSLPDALSNHGNYPFTLGGRRWLSVEHYYQASKFMATDPAHANKIASAPTPRAALELGRDTSRAINPDWDNIRDDVMYTALHAKFQQNPEAAAELLQAPQYIGADNHFSSDPYWGESARGGKNVLGRMLERVRSELVLPPYAGPVDLVTLKITTTSAELSAQPPSARPAISKQHHMVEPLSRFISMVFGRRLLGPAVVTFPPKRAEPTIHFPCAHPVEADRVETIAIQVFTKEIRDGLAGRTPFQQAILAGISEARIAISKDKMLPGTGPAMPGESHLFSVDDPGVFMEAKLQSLEPMLAQDGKTLEGTVKELTKRGVTDVFYQPKLDGLRLLCSRSGNGIVMVTRGGKVHRPISKLLEEHVLPYLDALEKEVGAGVVLDGELYVHKIPAEIQKRVSMTDKEWKSSLEGSALPEDWEGPLIPTQLGKITGAAASFKKEDLKSVACQRNMALLSVLEYHVFTYFRPDTGTPAWERYSTLARHLPVDSMNAVHYVCGANGRFSRFRSKIWLVPAKRGTLGDLPEFSKMARDCEYEGTMIYASGAPYRHTRAWELVKLKSTETEWFLVTGAAPEEGSPTANIVYRFGEKDYVASGFFSYAVKRRLYELGDSLYGLYALIRYQKINLSADGEGALRDPKVIYLSTSHGGAPLDIESL